MPDLNPKPELPQVYLVPVPLLILERVTHGLYYELSEFFKVSEKGNPFRIAFGFVFQEYVGTLLRKSLSHSEVLSEWVYTKENTRTTDWIILNEQKMILIEVKQAGLYLQGKQWGNIEQIKKELRQTVARAVKQLWRFERNIHSKKYQTLLKLSDIDAVERLVITYDRTYYSNSILREQVYEVLADELPELPKTYHWHTISIDELEFVLGLYGDDLFDFLEKKRLTPDNDNMDFWDYLVTIHKGEIEFHPYLMEIRNEFFHKEVQQS